MNNAAKPAQTGRRRAVGRLALLFLVFTGLTLPLCLAGDDELPTVIAEIEAFLEAHMAASGIPGAQIAMVVDGELLLSRGYGVKHAVLGGEVDDETRFRFGSIGKMMTAAALMLEWDAGRVDLNEPVTRLIPELEFAGRYSADDITLRDLLHHESGVPDLSEESCPGGENSLSEWAGSLGDVYLYNPPGLFYNYTNAGYSLLGLAAERSSGVRYHRFIRDHLWHPAGMLDTTPYPADVIASGNYTHGHYLDFETGEPLFFAPDDLDCYWSTPAGHSFSTARDLVRFAQLLTNGGEGLLSEAAIARMLGDRVPTYDLPEGQEYGYGLFATEIDGMMVYYHAGANVGWASNMVWVPEAKFAVAIVINTVAGTSAVTSHALESVLGLRFEDPEDPTTDPATWERYAGAYRLRDEEGTPFFIHVAHEADALTATLMHPELGLQVLPLEQLYFDTFWFDLDGDGMPSLLEMMTFIEGPEGPAARMWIRNRVYVGKRFGRPARVGRHGQPDPELLLSLRSPGEMPPPR